MAKYDDIKARQYLLITSNSINESSRLGINTIYGRLSNTNKYDLRDTISNINSDDVNNEPSILSEICKTICESSVPSSSKSSIAYSLIDIIKHVPSIKNYKEKINECADVLGSEVLRDNLKNLIECDRILNNQSILDKHSNFSRLFENHVYSEDVIEPLVFQSCDIIDNYKMNYNVKFTVALENILYNIEKNGYNCNRNEVIEYIFEYFSTKPEYSLDKCKTIMLNSALELTQDDLNCILEAQTLNKFEKATKEFYKTKDKTKAKFKQMIDKLYSTNPENIIDDLPGLFKCVRIGFLLFTASVSLPVGIVLLITDKIISVIHDRKTIDKALKKYRKEKEKVSDKSIMCSNPKTRKKYEQMEKELEDSIIKLETYRDSLYSDKEVDDIREKEYNEETEIIYQLAEFEVYKESIECYIQNNITNEICDYLGELDDTKDINDLFKVLDESYIIERNNIDISDVYSNLNNPDMAGSIIDNISRFKINNIHEMTEETNILEEMVYYNELYDIVHEGGIKAKAKIASIKAAKTVQRLTDKEKVLSNRIDSAFDRMRDKLDAKTTNRNREAVIKGSILPSFTSLLKLILVSGLTVSVVSSFLGVATFVAGLALSKKATDKERNYILQEIEVQLEIVEKKISLAESNNDMKALEQLLRIRKKLRQEKQRILYKGRARNFNRTQN